MTPSISLYTCMVLLLIHLISISANFSVNFLPELYNIPSTEPKLTSSTYTNLLYLPQFEIQFESTTTIDTTEDKHIIFKFENIFNTTYIPSPTPIPPPSDETTDETNNDETKPTSIDVCQITLCEDDTNNICVTYLVKSTEQEVLNTHEKLTITCNLPLKSILTTSASKLTSTIISTTTPSTILLTSITNTQGPTLFLDGMTTPYQLTISPQLILPNTDYQYQLNIIIPTTTSSSTSNIPNDILTFKLYTNYNAPFNITTCRAKDHNDNTYKPLGLTTIINTTIIEFTIDSNFFIPNTITTIHDSYRIDFYCIMHAANYIESISTGATFILYEQDQSTSTTQIFYIGQTNLPAITLVTTGLQIDYKLDQLDILFINQEQINSIITTTQTILSTSATTLLSLQQSKLTKSTLLSITKLSQQQLQFSCSVLTLEREFIPKYRYPGSTLGHWTIPTLSLYCRIHTSNGQTTIIDESSTLTYLTNIYSEATAMMWNMRNVCETSILYQMVATNTNIIPHPSPDGEDEDEEGAPDDEENNEENDDEEKLTIMFYENGTIYDPTIFELEQVDWTTLHLYQIQQRSIPSHCFNNVHDESLGETDIDCGGECFLCTSGKMCTTATPTDSNNETKTVHSCLFMCGDDNICTSSNTFQLQSIHVLFIATFIGFMINF